MTQKEPAGQTSVGLTVPAGQIWEVEQALQSPWALPPVEVLW